MCWKPNLTEHEQWNHLPNDIQKRVFNADSGTHAAWILLNYIKELKWNAQCASERIIELQGAINQIPPIIHSLPDYEINQS